MAMSGCCLRFPRTSIQRWTTQMLWQYDSPTRTPKLRGEEKYLGASSANTSMGEAFSFSEESPPPKIRLKTMDWKAYYPNLSEKRLTGEIKIMRSNFPYAKLKQSSEGKLFWLLNITVSKGIFLVSIVYQPSFPAIEPECYLIDPAVNRFKHSAHLKNGDQLCFYLSAWDTRFTAASTIPWIAHWIEEFY